MTSLFVNGTVANYNYMEGCFHFYSPPTQAWPGLLLSTGMEDYYDRYCRTFSLCFQSIIRILDDSLTVRPLPRLIYSH